MKQKELLEKDNGMKKLQRESQQELLKLRADIEIMNRDFNEKKNKQLSNSWKKTKINKKKMTMLYFSNILPCLYLICFFVSGSYDNTIHLCDIETSKSSHIFNGHENLVD
ncbi:hypothetical protein RFI_31627 [Reticulomyxa filosa]|uniref:Uncharacterized protein n=1 Tax=Reticulomyxa filosa TaxID=46433 RepID=X6LVX0_RETFI|nr:hypothetical protein RFI_31627 [Reticulomyxa filosa]|eukprot:ETO05769.1 hypothetical protein RFI_31627 [Reticulomyxa filosa]